MNWGLNPPNPPTIQSLAYEALQPRYQNPSKAEFLIIGIREQLSKLTYTPPTYFTQISLLSYPLQSSIFKSSLIKKRIVYLCRPQSSHHPAISNLLYTLKKVQVECLKF